MGNVTTASRRRTVRIAIAAGVAGLLGAAGWAAWPLLNQPEPGSYVGRDASVLAKDLGCAQYKQSPRRDQSVYKYRDQGTCVLNGTTVTITTFNRASDGEAFVTLMNGLIPVLHPTWVGAASAAGEGWNVADTTNLSPEIAESVIVRLRAGAVRVIPSARG